jgi:class 3 adenylate cyclase/tetratricopeptide (TPR) repeat protein
VAACPACSGENREGARFCDSCGTLLAPEPVASQEERKVVSILFVDVVGSTARGDGADPEDVRGWMRPYHSRLKQEIERFGGTVEKFIGDAVVAVVGAPIAHEDDAERAVLAALRAVQAIDELNEEQSLDIAVRAAVATGEVVVSLGARPAAGESIVTGDVVNTAARLQEHAPAGGVVVGEQTFRATRHRIEYEELPLVSVKGKAEALRVFRPVRGRDRFGDTELGRVTAFVGRAHELTRLREIFATTLRERRVEVVTVLGEPGIGKSRLVREFKSSIHDRPTKGVRWRQGRCLPYGDGVTLWALGEIVKAESGILESDGPAEAEAKLVRAVDAAVDNGSERQWLTGRLAPLVGLGRGGAERTESFAACRRFLEVLAGERPLVVFFEDLHWADAALLDFIEELVEASAGAPMLVVCSARPELSERRPGWGGGKSNATTIELAPLSQEDTARLVSGLLAKIALPAETQTMLLERAGGNPLYAEEFARMVTDRDGLVRREGSVEILGDIPVPETIHALLTGRLDTLNRERKALLCDASVLGRVFWAGAVASMGSLDKRRVVDGLRELARKEFIRPVRSSSIQGELEFAFWHVLVRDVAYGQIPRAARSRKHRAAAEWIERIAGDRIADHAEVLAHHSTQALELARAARDPAAAKLKQPARRFLVMAGERTVDLDRRTAETYYRRALELAPPGHDKRPDIVERLASALARGSGMKGADPLPFYEEAIEGFRKRGDLLSAGGAMFELAHWVRLRLSDPERAENMATEALGLIEGHPPGSELARAYSSMSKHAMLSGRPDKSLSYAEKALALAKPMRLEEIHLNALQMRGNSRCELGDLERGLADLRDALTRGLAHGLGQTTAAAYWCYGDWLWLIDGPAAGLANHHAGKALAQERGNFSWAAWLELESCWMLFDLGKWDEILAISAKWLAVLPSTPQGVMIPLSYRVLVLVLRGDVPSAATLASQLLPSARGMDPQIFVPVLVAAALVEQAQGRIAEASALVEELEQTTRGTSAFHRARFLTDALRIATAADQWDLAQRLMHGIGASAARHRHALIASEAILAEAAGDMERAAELGATAADRWHDYGFVLEEGQALLALGRCLVSLGRAREANASLEEARELFAKLRAQPLVGATAGWLRRAAAVGSTERGA